MSEQPAEKSWVDLPVFIEEPLEVYLNGIAQQAGVDYQLADGALLFSRPLVAEQKMSRIQWLLVAVGIGSYPEHDSVDVIYEQDGRRLVASGLAPRERDP